MTPTPAHVPLHPEGPELSPIIWGAMRLTALGGPQEVLRFIHGCLELGITTFDHADIYGDYTAERRFGEAIALEPTLLERIQLISKCGITLVSSERPDHRVHGYDTSRAHIVASVERSLRDLGAEALDLLLIHRPDPLLDADEVAEAFAELRARGMVHFFGVSNFAPHHFELLQSRWDEPLVTNQIELSLLHLSPLHDGTLDQCQQLGIRPLLWSPLAGGALFRGEGEREARVRAELELVAEELGATPMQVALGWLLRHPSKPLPILGTLKLERLREAVGALGVTLSRQQWFRLWSASTGHEVP